jgi:hypothetical protein
MTKAGELLLPKIEEDYTITFFSISIAQMESPAQTPNVKNAV